ncbi:hypothetical protein [Achromobacter arsenitoxydans]|uniref:hypothetical protein n=1 Tax=Achromobacter arsenitoxydans TaxID=1147684 RepID=UPI001111CDFD|nr:hypothetical protein [Achromobacter arsenitoxydans]
MTDKFVLWAQALDNASPDHFEMLGKMLDAEDTVQRQKAVSLVSSVIKKGSRVREQSGVILTADRRHFILEVPSAQCDNAGRTAPIVCYGDYRPFSNSHSDSAATALDDFTRKIGRTLRPEHRALVRESLESLKKNVDDKARTLHWVRGGRPCSVRRSLLVGTKDFVIRF